MGDSPDAGFGKFVPGFDFLQSLAQGAAQTIPRMPDLASWVAPSLNAEEIDKRIGELKAVHFWLEQNSRVLDATIQALEVQKMTLAALQGMNFNLSDVAKAFQLKPAHTVAPTVQRVNEKAASTAETLPDPASGGGDAAPAAQAENKSTKSAEPMAGLVDPLQLWGALTQQFQQIAASAMKDAARNTATGAPNNVAAGKATKRPTSAGVRARPAPGKAAARKAAVRKG